MVDDLDSQARGLSLSPAQARYRLARSRFVATRGDSTRPKRPTSIRRRRSPDSAHQFTHHKALTWRALAGETASLKPWS